MLGIEPELIDVGAIAQQVITEWMPEGLVERRGLRGCPKLLVDPRLFPAALRELLDNAVKFSPEGGKVKVTCLRRDGEVGISVTDRGIGISREDLDRIRQEFVQLDPTATRAFGGIGLGLRYVQRIVEGHGGRLEFDSTVGKGSTFTMIYPVPDAEQTSRFTKESSKRPDPSR